MNADYISKYDTISKLIISWNPEMWHLVSMPLSRHRDTKHGLPVYRPEDNTETDWIPHDKHDILHDI